jgi:phosphonate transport system substrate-binding protein
MRYLIPLFLSFFIALNASGACLGDKSNQDRPYSFYIVPQLAVSDTYVAWAPILDKVGKKLSICFDLRVPLTIPLFERDLNSGVPDFAFMNPYHLFHNQRSQDYTPLIADSQNQLFGIIVIKKDSPVSTIADLNGQKLAFPAPNSLAASLLIRAHLAKSQVSITPEYVKTHSNVYRSVIIGDVIAGGGVNNTFTREPESLQKELKILFETPKYMPHPLAASSRVPPKIRKEVVQYFIELGKDPSMAKQLNAIQIPKPVEVNLKDYDYVKKLGLDKFAEGSGG